MNWLDRKLYAFFDRHQTTIERVIPILVLAFFIVLVLLVVYAMRRLA